MEVESIVGTIEERSAKGKKKIFIRNSYSFETNSIFLFENFFIRYPHVLQNRSNFL